MIDGLDVEAEAIRLLGETEKPLRVIAENCGVTTRYIRYLKDGKLKDPGINKTTRVYKYLSGRRLKAV